MEKNSITTFVVMIFVAALSLSSVVHASTEPTIVQEITVRVDTDPDGDPSKRFMLGVTENGTLAKYDLLGVPGATPPYVYYVISDDGSSYGLDLTARPDLEAAVSQATGKFVFVEGWLYFKTTVAPTGQEIEWLLIEVNDFSVAIK